MEYRIAKGWKIFGYSFSFLFFVGGMVCFLQAISADSTWPVPLAWTGTVLGLVLAGYSYLYGARTVYILDDHTLTVAGPFKTRSIPLNEIAGYRVGEKQRFYVITNNDVSIGIPGSLERSSELVAWFKGKYMDVDLLEQQKDNEAILENEEFGADGEARLQRLALAKKIDIAASVTGYALLVASLFYNRPEPWIMAIFFIAPWVGVAVTWYYKGLFKLYKKNKGVFPSVVQLMGLGTLAAFVIVVIRGYRIYGYSQHAMQILVVATTVAVALCIIGCRQAIATSRRKPLTYFCIVVVASVYCFSLMIYYNCRYDTSPDQVYSVAVTSKRTVKGKSTSYYVSVTSWGRYTDGQELSVSRQFYLATSEGDSIRILLDSGKFQIPWYRVVR
jgi:hypothetical protein